jgi:hypothetical protein
MCPSYYWLLQYVHCHLAALYIIISMINCVFGLSTHFTEKTFWNLDFFFGLGEYFTGNRGDAVV